MFRLAGRQRQHLRLRYLGPPGGGAEQRYDGGALQLRWSGSSHHGDQEFQGAKMAVFAVVLQETWRNAAMA